jgi:hypothetical protein
VRCSLSSAGERTLTRANLRNSRWQDRAASSAAVAILAPAQSVRNGAFGLLASFIVYISIDNTRAFPEMGPSNETSRKRALPTSEKRVTPSFTVLLRDCNVFRLDQATDITADDLAERLGNEENRSRKNRARGTAVFARGGNADGPARRQA